jgi:hypothetical protein
MVNTKKDVRPVRTRNYLNKDFNSFRADLLTYARAFYADRIQDFSENSLGGLLLDFAAYVGDVNSFYLDHQFQELFSDTAVEPNNLQNLIRAAGVEITGNSPAVVDVDIFIELPAVLVGNTYEPRPDVIPVIRQNSIAAANNGVRFNLTEDVDFRDLDEDGNFVAELRIGSTNADGSPLTLIMKRTATFISGFVRTETFSIENNFVPFRTIRLTSEDVTEILSILDTEGNEYYRVEALTQDTVFRAIPNLRGDSNIVEDLIEVIPAPYRFTAQTDVNTRQTTCTFGGGTADSLDNDIIPDPSEFAVPLFGKRTFSRFSIDPNNLLNTRTLGVAPQNTTLTVQYRHGGGLTHNVAAESIRTMTTLLMQFPGFPPAALAASVRASVDINNPDPAAGGENAPSLDELRFRIPSARNSQSRIVSKEDLLARVYTMPSNFGRVFRAGVRANPTNPLATQLFIVSRDSSRQLTTSPDALKDNLVTYLNRFRMTSDAIDILDSPIVNIGIQFEIATEADSNKSVIVQNVIARLQRFFRTENFQIDTPIRLADVQNLIYNNPGVLSITELKVRSLTGNVNGRIYSDSTFNVNTNTIKGLVFPPQGGIFEIRFPEFDIVGSGI